MKLRKGVSLALATSYLVGCSTVNRKISSSYTNKYTDETEVAWTHYAGNAFAQKFSPANLINQDNAKNMEFAWKWVSDVDQKIINEKSVAGGKIYPMLNESTPLMMNGTLFAFTSLNQVVAIDATTGKTIWTFDTKGYEDGYPPNLGFVQRGLSIATTKSGDKRIIVTTSNSYMYSLKLDGTQDTDFGVGGKVDIAGNLQKITGIETPRKLYAQSSPPAICNNTIIVGSVVADAVKSSIQKAPVGDVQAFDLKTGEFKWSFKTLGENVYSTEKSKKNPQHIGNANVWTFMSTDEELNSVYLPTSTASNDFYGGDRKGKNEHAESIVSLNCETGKRNWSFQTVHHGLWDYDLPAAPILMNIKVRQKNERVLAQLTKQGFVFVLYRENGKPVWPIKEKPVKASDVPGEQAWPTQPFPTAPPPYAMQGLLEKDLINVTPEINQEAKDFVKKNGFKYSNLYDPPSLEGTFVNPGNVGGASWAGGSFNPTNGKLYVPTITLPYLTKLMPADETTQTKYIRDVRYVFPRQPSGIPLVNPPYGKITSYQLDKGEKLWDRPMGDVMKSIIYNHPSLKGKQKPQEEWGSPFRTHILTTPNVLFAAQEGLGDVRFDLTQNEGRTIIYKATNIAPELRILNLESGEVIHRLKIEANAFGAIMTYVSHNEQYVVIPYGGGIENDSGFLAYKLK